MLDVSCSEPNDQVFTSNACSHRFHKDCIMDWLQRRANTECPCCREPMVSDENVWQIVKELRKERRKLFRQENGLLHRCTRPWKLLRNRHHHQEEDLVSAGTEVSSSTARSVEEGRVVVHNHGSDNNNLGQGNVPTLSETESYETESDTASEAATELSDEVPAPRETELETATELSYEAPTPRETESDAASESETEPWDEKTFDNEKSGIGTENSSTSSEVERESSTRSGANREDDSEERPDTDTV
jgi:hypothetical protein